MVTTTRHMSLNLNGFLRNIGKKKITIFDDEHGNRVSDAEARKYIQECLAKWWKLIPLGGENICEGFDHFGGGCPGHPVTDKT